MSRVPKPLSARKREPNIWNAPEKSRKKKSIEHEKRISKEMNFTQTISSGALDVIWQKEDGYDKTHVYQLKETDAKDARIIKVKDLLTLVKRAYEQVKDPVMVITFTNAESPMPRDWVMIPKDAWKNG